MRILAPLPNALPAPLKQDRRDEKTLCLSSDFVRPPSHRFADPRTASAPARLPLGGLKWIVITRALKRQRRSGPAAAAPCHRRHVPDKAGSPDSSGHLRFSTTLWYNSPVAAAEIENMNKHEFCRVRTRLGKTQTQMAALLRTSPKAIQSYEQGWRSIPAHAERQILFLLSMKSSKKNRKACWIVRHCPPESRRNCPAWEFKAGAFCWFINGTLCEGRTQQSWNAKMKICRSCAVMHALVAPE